MGLPWYLKSEWTLHAEMLDKQDELTRSASASYSRDRDQDKQIEALQKRVRELESQLLALEKLLSEKGILPPLPEEPESEPERKDTGKPVLFPARTEDTIDCPRCGKRQRGDRDFCYACETPFRYETE